MLTYVCVILIDFQAHCDAFIQNHSECTYNLTLRIVRVTIVAVEKTMNITYSVCVKVVLGIQHAVLMCRIISPFVAPPAVTQFSTLSHKWYDSQKQAFENKFCVSIFSRNFVSNMYHSKIIQPDNVINVHVTSCKVPFILARL